MSNRLRLPARSLLATLLSGISLASAAQVVVIVNPKAADSPSAEQVAALYLGKSGSLPGGIRQALDLPDASPLREPFYTKATGKNSCTTTS